ncbi:heterokaryon incompatibility protein [Colletotrichum tofieldiae]|uniref:Heterokaryon incompatibility protein n=1 Tax=Colletotrichum tofieldiae TaxID=708197 RepID=A0A166TWQ0_9PEZI|nr:heterokaryon incompatibility protein [Colletotrichum tofieldiae]
MRNSIFQSPRWHFAPLMFLASAATATTISIGDASLSLSNFQLITELSVPLGCLLAYNNPIQGCEATDFDSTRTCSAKLQVNTLLGQALAGNLVNLLCGATNQPTSSPVQTIKPSTTTRRQAAAAAAAAATIFYLGRSTSTVYYLCHSASTTNYNIDDSNSNANSASPSSSTTTVDHSSAAGRHSGTAAAAASANNHCHFNNHDRKSTSTSEHFYKASG